jgi:hypothetical protein
MRQLRTSAARLRWFVVVAAISMITLAASSPIYSAVRGHAVGPISASPLTALATADCSEAAATEIVLRLQLNDPEVAAPVGRLLCGSFTGPGSQTMVASLWGPGNSGWIHWVVFRWVGDAWQFVMKQPAAASITAAGSDIRQTLPIYRPQDSRCCPTGGTKTRIWHWDGSRFVAGPWTQVTGEPLRTTFRSPSRNIECSMSDDRTLRSVRCQSGRSPQSVTMGADGQLRICRGVRCVWCGCDENEAAAPRLGYGRQMVVGRFRCLSQRSGVTCTVVRSGRGFSIDSTRVRRVAP